MFEARAAKKLYTSKSQITILILKRQKQSFKPDRYRVSVGITKNKHSKVNKKLTICFHSTHSVSTKQFNST